MVNEELILAAERLRDDLAELRTRLRERYPKSTRQVVADDIRTESARLAEVWLVGIATDQEATAAIGPKTAADLSVHFQRILTYSEHATIRTRYDATIRAILKNYTVSIVLALKRHRGSSSLRSSGVATENSPILSAFVGQSFAGRDAQVNKCVIDTLTALGVATVTGERPKADWISDKVKGLIDAQNAFVGVFTCRDKIVRRSEWTTSTWVIDEKAYAVARRKKLILLKERGVGSIGGIQGDYEFIDFSRDSLERLPLDLMHLFELTNRGLRK
jgi:hypothetical protein